jgi:transposase InsO family protein
MPRGVAHGPETRSFLMGLHAQGRSLSDLSREFGIPRQVLSRWWQRVATDGLEGLAPRSRRPHRTSAIAKRTVQRILQLRRRRLGPARIAVLVGVSAKTVHRVLTRHGQARLPRPRRRPAQRYEKSRPGELLHVDIKLLPALRNARYDYEFAAVDDFSREAVVTIATDQTSRTATAFLERVVATLPYPVEAVLTDNAFAFTMRYAQHADRLTRFEQACRSLGITHHLLRPRRPQSNGKVERFFRTIDDECLALQRRWTFAHRLRAVEAFVRFYNHERPHLSLNGMTPVERRDNYFSSSRLSLMS